MKETIEIQAVELIRRIRDEQAQLLAGKSAAEVIAFFRRAGKAAKENARRLSTRSRSKQGVTLRRKQPKISTPRSANSK